MFAIENTLIFAGLFRLTPICGSSNENCSEHSKNVHTVHHVHTVHTLPVHTDGCCLTSHMSQTSQDITKHTAHHRNIWEAAPTPYAKIS